MGIIESLDLMESRGSPPVCTNGSDAITFWPEIDVLKTNISQQIENTTEDSNDGAALGVRAIESAQGGTHHPSLRPMPKEVSSDSKLERC